MSNELIGTSGLHPWDSKVTHDLLRSLNPTYVRLAISYTRWNSQIGIDYPAFYDKMHELNSIYKIILVLHDVPLEEISTWVTMILKRYTVWGVSPVNEMVDNDMVSKRIKAFAAVAPEVRLIGPD